MILSIRYAPEFTSNAVVITGLAQQLAARGHQVTVLTGTPHNQLPRMPAGYAWRIFRREIRAGVKVIYCWAFPKSGGKAAKLLNYLTFTLTSLAALLTQRPEAILVVSPPFWLGFSAAIARGLRGGKVIYNAQDLYPEAYVASREVRPGALTRVIRSLVTCVYRKCDGITVITNSFADKIAALGIASEKITMIPNYVDTSAVRPLPRCNSFRRQHNLEDRFVVMYAGNIGYTHGAELLVEAAAKLSENSHLLFVVVGGGAKLAKLEKMAQTRELTNLKFLPAQPPEALPEMLAAADAFVITTKPGVGQASFPGRIYNFLLAARPVVASVDEDSDLAQLLRKADCGIVTQPGNVEDFCRAIAALCGDAELRRRMGSKGAGYMAENYSPQSVVEKYEAVLKSFTARSGRHGHADEGVDANQD